MSQPRPVIRETMTTRWRSLEERYLHRLRGPDAKAAAAELARIPDLPPFPRPESWLHWMQLGRWLQRPTGTPPAFARAEGMPRIWSEVEKGRVHEFFTGEALKPLDPKLLVMIYDIAGECPDDSRSWLLLGAALMADGQRALANSAYRQAKERAAKERFALKVPPFVLETFREWAHSATEPGIGEVIWPFILRNKIYKEVLAVRDGGAHSGFLETIGMDPELTACTVEQAADYLVQAQQLDLARRVLANFLKLHPHAQPVTFQAMLLALEDADLEEAARHARRLPEDSPITGGCLKTPYQSAEIWRCLFLQEVEASRTTVPAIYKRHPNQLQLQVYEVGRLMEVGEWTKAESLARSFIPATHRYHRYFDHLVIDLAMGPAPSAWVREEAHRRLFATPLDWLAWDTAIGYARSGPARAWLQTMMAELKTREGSSWTVRTLEALALSRDGKAEEAVDCLVAAQRAAPKDTLVDAETACEILVRPHWERLVGVRHGSELWRKLARHAGPQGNAATVEQWVLVRNGDYKKAALRASLQRAQQPYRCLWSRILLWNARHEGPSVWARTALSVRTALRAHSASQWLLGAMEELAPR